MNAGFLTQVEQPPASRLNTLLRPNSLAFVGVSTRGGSGSKMLRSAQKSGFPGPLWLVHPSAQEIAGLPCFPSFAALPSAPDCVVVSVPAPAVLGVLEQAAAAGTTSALVVSEGFSDAGDESGRERQRELAAFARRTGMAIAGPNCMGVASFVYQFAATMADIPERSSPGGVSLVSQSGGLLNAVAELCANRGVGLNYLISIGNQAVVDLADYIEFLIDDSATRVIAVIMEGITDGPRFRAALNRAAGRKPLAILKLGRSAFGQAATLAHTGTLAGRHEAFTALFRQTGAALVDSLDELVETAALFATAAPPKGSGVCMFTVSGGATSLIGDLGDKAGLRFPPLQPPTVASLQRILDVDRTFQNPIDTVGMPRLLKDGNIDPVLDALIADQSLDVIALVLGMRMQGAPSHDELIARMAKRVAGAGKPLVVISFVSNSLTGKWRGFAAEHGLPLIEDLECGLKAIRHLIDFAQCAPIREAPASKRNPSSARELKPGETLTEAESKRLLAAAGFPITRELLAADPPEAARRALEIGGPVAIKIQSPDIAHKSDVGGVRLGVRGAEEAEAAARDVLTRSRSACPHARIDGVLVQEMVEEGAEFILGMSYDDQFGPVVAIGAGGVTVEVFRDVATLLPPVSRSEIVEAVDSLRAKALLEGFRGAPPRDASSLVDVCMKFCDFVAETEGQFLAIEINPLFVLSQGKGVRVGDALIVTAEERRANDQYGEAKHQPIPAAR